MTTIPTVGQSGSVQTASDAEVNSLLLQMQASADQLFNELKMKSPEERHRIVRELAATKEIICAIYPVQGGFGYQVIKGSVDHEAFKSGRAQSIPCGNAGQIADLVKLLAIQN